ncbi:DUF6526 family protein [Gemmatimonas sp.]|uniref:DUF6526 family protein n=1 Tax=Gemmatimonas sp. TaxID=1962908 RepID=UPI003982DADF
MADKTQNFANHGQYVPMYHFFASPLALIFVIWSVQRLITNPGADTAYMLVGALALFGVVAVSRLSPLRAQDRLIRLEEQLRYVRLLPTDLAARAQGAFSPRHYIALRFASDAELASLVDMVIKNPEMKGKEIKSNIKTWRPDHFRV